MNGTHRLRIALIGGGTIAPLHAKYLLPSSQWNLIAIIDPFTPGKRLAEQLSIPHYSNIGELIASEREKPIAYAVCVPSNLHITVATEILNVASPSALLIEKPFSTDSATGEQLLNLAKSKGCTIAVGHHRRFHAAIVKAQETIASGQLGSITALSGVWTCKKNDGYFSASHWRTSKSAGGGPIWTNFVHEIDTLHFLVGSRVVRLWATKTSTRRAHASVKKDDHVEEGAAIMLQFGNGVVGTFVQCDNVASPFGWESASGDNPDYAASEIPIDCYRLFGTKGTLSVPDGNLYTYSDERATALGSEVGWNVPMERSTLNVEESVPFERQSEHLARIVTNGEAPVCSGDDGLAAVKVCEAVMEALARSDGGPIDVL